MFIPPPYTVTPEIVKSLQSIEAVRSFIDVTVVPPEIERIIRRISTLKSAVFSARIEGNPLRVQDFSAPTPHDQKKREVFNILKALNLLHRQPGKLTVKDILHLHKIVMERLVSEAELGRLRTEVSAIYDASGIAIYLPPAPQKILILIRKLLSYCNASIEHCIPIRACLAHYTFEKIHPFLDGNGRVGRLLLQAVLVKGEYGMKRLISLEEYLDDHRSEYYQSLEAPEQDVTDYLAFMLNGLASAAQDAQRAVLAMHQGNVADTLLPRRAEILHIIQDHRIVSFETIHRRFLAVNERTLRYDLKKLVDLGLVRKRGVTKGVYYEFRE